MWFPLPPSPSSLLICWCFLCWWVSSSRRNPGVPSFYPFFFYGRPPPAMGVGVEPSLIRTLPGACGLSSLRDEVQTLPSVWAHSRLLGTLPRVVPVVSAPSEMSCTQSRWVAGWRGDWSCCCRGIPQSAPEGLFPFGENPPAGSCGSLRTRKGLTSRTAHLSS